MRPWFTSEVLPDGGWELVWVTLGQCVDQATSPPPPRVDASRISKSFAAFNVTGLRLLMTLLSFRRLFMAPRGAAPGLVASQYDKCCSLLPHVSPLSFLPSLPTAMWLPVCLAALCFRLSRRSCWRKRKPSCL